MSNGIAKKLAGAVARLLLAYALVFGQSVWAGQEPKAKDSPKPTQTAATQQTGEKPSSVATAAKPQSEELQGEVSEKAAGQEKSSGDGKREGIKVHGHWTIEVRNPDGSLATRRDFDNSLVGGANLALSTVLGRTNLVGQWAINLFGGSAGGPCPGSVNNNLGVCIIEESGGPITGSGVFQTLTIAPVPNASGVYSLQLSGNATASGSTQIGTVQTFLNVCPGGGPSCPPITAIGAGYLFSQASLSTGINVSSGQVIQVTVVFSFS